MFTNHIYLIYMNKPDLAFNNLQWLICHKTKLDRHHHIPPLKRVLNSLILF